MRGPDRHRTDPKPSAVSVPPDNRSFAPARIGSERSFGIQVGAVLAIVGLWPLAHGGPPRLWALIASALLLLSAAFVPAWLQPVNRLWSRFGLLLGRVVTPLVMGLLFFLVVTPIALLLRLFGKDVLRLRKDDSASSYWVTRTPPGPKRGSMRDQF